MRWVPPFAYPDQTGRYRNLDTTTAKRGSFPSGELFNALLDELVLGLIAKSGFTPAEADLLQIAKAVRSQRLNLVNTPVGVFGGTANALSGTLDPAPATLAELVGVPIRGIASAANTGAATFTVPGTGGPLTGPVRRINVPLVGGEIQLGAFVTLIWDGTQFQLMGGTGGGAGSGVPPYLQIRQVRAQGVAPQSSTSTTSGTGNWVTRLLNTVVANTISGAALNVGTGHITLPAGSYKASFAAMANNGGNHRGRLYNQTASAELVAGLTGDTFPGGADPVTAPSVGQGRFVLTGTATLSLDHVNFDAPYSGGSWFLGDDSQGAQGTFSLWDADLMIEKEA